MKFNILLVIGAVMAAASALPAVGQVVAPAMPSYAPFVPSMKEPKPAMADGQQGPGQSTSVPGPTTAPRPALVGGQAATAAGMSMVTEVPVGPRSMSDAVAELRAFRDSDVKFSVSELRRILRDSRHEGWVLAAYPDPKTGHPLIGAGFTLDLPSRPHPQTDPMNPHPFMEPSSAELWEAAGLDAARLHEILNTFDTRLAAWDKSGFRRKMTTLTPQISDEDAGELVRVSILQSAYNAKAYCRDFDRLTASQQMALTQLVYQMGYNLQEFSTFLALINNYAERAELAGAEGAASAAVGRRSDFSSDKEYWRTVQQSLISSQWARLYRARAVAVIAMLDPQYGVAPMAAEMRVGAMLRPAVVHKSRRGAVASRRAAGKGSRSKGRRPKKRGV